MCATHTRVKQAHDAFYQPMKGEWTVISYLILEQSFEQPTQSWHSDSVRVANLTRKGRREQACETAAGTRNRHVSRMYSGVGGALAFYNRRNDGRHEANRTTAPKTATTAPEETWAAAILRAVSAFSGSGYSALRVLIGDRLVCVVYLSQHNTRRRRKRRDIRHRQGDRQYQDGGNAE